MMEVENIAVLSQIRFVFRNALLSHSHFFSRVLVEDTRFLRYFFSFPWWINDLPINQSIYACIYTGQGEDVLEWKKWIKHWSWAAWGSEGKESEERDAGQSTAAYAPSLFSSHPPTSPCLAYTPVPSTHLSRPIKFIPNTPVLLHTLPSPLHPPTHTFNYLPCIYIF